MNIFFIVRVGTKFLNYVRKVKERWLQYDMHAKLFNISI